MNRVYGYVYGTYSMYSYVCACLCLCIMLTVQLYNVTEHKNITSLIEAVHDIYLHKTSASQNV
jgi:hypothetical protein